MIKCTNCGYENEEGSKYCNNCGGLIETGNETNNAIPKIEEQQQPKPQPQKNVTKPAQNPKKTDGLCIAGLSVGIFALLISLMYFMSSIYLFFAICVGVVGIPLSIIGVVKAKKKHIGGKGMGIVGIAFSAVPFLLLGAVLLLSIYKEATKNSGIDKTNAFGGTIEIFNSELTFGKDYEITTDDSYYSDYYQKDIVALPVHIKNISSETSNPSLDLIINVYDPDGRELDNVYSEFDDTIYSFGQLRSGSETDFKIYFPYEDKGTYYLKITTLNIWNDEEIELGFPIKAVGSSSSNTTDSTDEMDETTPESTEARVFDYEITNQYNKAYWSDKLFIIAEVTNTGNTYIEIENATFDIEDLDGHYLTGTSTSDVYGGKVLSVLAPGEKGYVYTEYPVNEDYLKMDTKVIVNVRCSDLGNKDNLFVDLDIFDTSIRDDGGLTGLVVAGRVTNDSSRDSRVDLYAILYDSDNKPIAYLKDMFVNVPAESTIGFEVDSSIGIGEYTELSDVDHYEVFARIYK